MKDSIGLIHDLVDMVETLAMLDLRMCHMCEDIAAKKHDHLDCLADAADKPCGLDSGLALATMSAVAEQRTKLQVYKGEIQSLEQVKVAAARYVSNK
ncbi:MAG: hypothetical protein FRX49_11213 [Trebouxia sp. A1-2]|nr:MAG: hypothetical protein FRX49_11213 [Trebouxia sp. A1-2]